MKIKLKNKPIPHFDSYCGLSVKDWIKINSGKKIEVKSISDKLEKYVDVVEEKPKVLEEKPKKEKE